MPPAHNAKGKVLVLVGPTAVGKSTFAIRLAGQVGGEIISSDSMQVYKGMAILSQAPAPAQMKGIQHHLISCIDPAREYSAADFAVRARRLIRSIIRRGKVPIIVGGSGLYVKGLIDGLFPSPKKNIVLRSKLERFAVKHGNSSLYSKLIGVDPESAAKIHPNDIRRVIRALEIHSQTGKTMTELKTRTKGLSGKYDIKMIGLMMPRNKIYKAIDSRVDRMLNSGVLKEVAKLRKKRVSQTAMAALGIKELLGYMRGEHSLKEAAEKMKMNTRRFAKRQLTWFRADKRIAWLDVTKTKEKALIKKVSRIAGG